MLGRYRRVKKRQVGVEGKVCCDGSIEGEAVGAIVVGRRLGITSTVAHGLERRGKKVVVCGLRVMGM